jgi:hypothetical protein
MGRVFQVLQEQLHLAKLVIREQNRENRRQRIILLGKVRQMGIGRVPAHARIHAHT